MKKIAFFRKIYLFEIIAVLVVTVVTSSCKKEDEIAVEPPVSVVKSDLNLIPKENLIKFLAISLGIEKSEINFDSKTDQFIVRGSLKYSRSEIAGLYENANIYQATYGK